MSPSRVDNEMPGLLPYAVVPGREGGMRFPKLHGPVWQIEKRQHVGFVVMFFASIVLVQTGCGVKRTREFIVSPKLLAARTATLGELLNLLKSRSEQLSSLSSQNLKVSFTSGTIASGRLEEYRRAPGYVLLKRPDSLRLNIQNPLTKTAIIELASTGDDFSLWYPRDNKYFQGHNSTKKFEVEEGDGPAFTARPIHIFEAIIPHKIDLSNPNTRIALEESQDNLAKYYVISIYRQAATYGGQRLLPVRRLWIERSELVVVKQKTFERDGSVASIIQYSDLSPVDGILLPLLIKLERPVDGYFLEMRFKSWRLNPDLPQTAFALSPPPRSQRIYLKEKGRSVTP